MKNKILAFCLLAVTVAGLSSCVAARPKYGCPMSQGTGKFKG